MIERRRIPCGRRMALVTVMTEIAGCMTRVCRAREVSGMTTVAICRQTCIHTVLMAGIAGHRPVSPRQRERGC